MIPRLKPYLGREELLAALGHQEGAVTRFEEAFARTFETKHAISFPYGRSGLWAFFRALGIEGAEVIMPAYTCVVVAHAIVLGNNIPRFVDITLYDYNMDLDQVEKAINQRTRAIIATHLFGYPLDVDRLGEIVRTAEARFGTKIWIVQDCAHAFGARWDGKLVCNEGDAALFGLNISKIITSVFGGMITTNNSDIYRKVRDFRDKHFVHPGLLKRIRRFLYLLAVYPAFNEHVYEVVSWLQERTSLLDHYTKGYHLDGKIHFPPDYLDQMIELEAKVGLVQLSEYPEIIRRRQENVRYYDQRLRDVGVVQVPPVVEGATYSHYAARVQDREAMKKALQERGVELGEVIDYSLPHSDTYRTYAGESAYPHSRHCSDTMINLPIHADLRTGDRELTVEAVLEYISSRGNRVSLRCQDF